MKRGGLDLFITVGPNGLVHRIPDDSRVAGIEEEVKVSVLETVGSPRRTVWVSYGELGRLRRGGTDGRGAARLTRWGRGGLWLLEGGRAHSRGVTGDRNAFLGVTRARLPRRRRRMKLNRCSEKKKKNWALPNIMRDV